jgi:type III secretory pathway component EscS
MSTVSLQENILPFNLKILQLFGCLLHLLDIGDELPFIVLGS